MQERKTFGRRARRVGMKRARMDMVTETVGETFIARAVKGDGWGAAKASSEAGMGRRKPLGMANHLHAASSSWTTRRSGLERKGSLKAAQAGNGNSGKRKAQKRKDLVQTKLCFGQQSKNGQKNGGSTKTCPRCGMLVAAFDVDAAAHKKFCKKVASSKTSGIYFGSLLTTSSRIVKTISGRSGHQIIEALPESKLRCSEEFRSLSLRMEDDLGMGSATERAQRCTCYIYLIDGHAVGCVEVRRVDSPEFAVWSRPIAENGGGTNVARDEEEARQYAKRGEVKLGVEAIWVLQHHRGKGFATEMLDAARHHFAYGRRLQKTECAMSQPTREGQIFANRYFEPETTFYVYDCT